MEFLTEAIKQVPSLAVLAFIVWIFVREMNRWRDLFSEISKTLDATAGRCHDLQTKTLELLGRWEEIIKRIEPKLNRMQ